MAQKKKPNKYGIIVVKKMRNYDNDPFFIKKAERAKAMIEKYGLPFEEKDKKSKSKKINGTYKKD